MSIAIRDDEAALKKLDQQRQQEECGNTDEMAHANTGDSERLLADVVLVCEVCLVTVR
ncbi:hypothetical protein LPB67_03435 [Undibacterium sp. Jales W-56]|uniref:hypothetical protein n=1 Tax=Undibacterium sp. Jales W-56 TaxID=2897325 RepID=UPI0021CFDF2F|nr:hypothetical protein [Undibacterium sp. Jales W-56]MCU6432830.1 hypothetical protein [Undibacterium sp. Jales W-56]